MTEQEVIDNFIAEIIKYIDNTSSEYITTGTSTRTEPMYFQGFEEEVKAEIQHITC